jgi:hypothetical protein
VVEISSPDTATRLTVEGLRTVFKVDKTPGKEPNTLDLQLTNLSQDTRGGIQKKGAKVVVLAGYGDDHAQIFSGDARLVNHTREGADWITRIQAGDAERQHLYARANESFAPGTSVQAVATYLVKQLTANRTLDPGNAYERLAAITGPLREYVHGYTVHGRASTVLDRVLKGVGLSYSVQDGVIQILAPGEAAKVLAVELAPDSGLLGSPEQCAPAVKGGKPVLKVRCLLNPRILPGRKISIKSENHTGIFKVGKLTHEGDTSAGPWFTSFECETYG